MEPGELDRLLAYVPTRYPYGSPTRKLAEAIERVLSLCQTNRERQGTVLAALGPVDDVLAVIEGRNATTQRD